MFILMILIAFAGGFAIGTIIPVALFPLAVVLGGIWGYSIATLFLRAGWVDSR